LLEHTHTEPLHFWEMLWQYYLHDDAECVKELKDMNVRQWRQHAATTGNEHCNGCVGYLASAFKTASLP